MFKRQNYPCYGCIVPESRLSKIADRICAEFNIPTDHYKNRNVSPSKSLDDEGLLAAELLQYDFCKNQKPAFVCKEIPHSYMLKDFGVQGDFLNDHYYFIGFTGEPATTEVFYERPYSPD